MKLNYIDDIRVSADEDVHVKDESILLVQPDRRKDKLGMFNFWSEKKRKNISDDAVCHRLVLDYDDGLPRAEAEEKFKGFSYMMYSSAGNDSRNGVEKFRVVLDLRQPVKASDLKWWRNRRSFREYFNGVDFSSFAIGRFFYRPGKRDKGRR